MKDKYLKITLHDNDFSWELQNVCRLLSMYLPDTKILEMLQAEAISDKTIHSSSNESIKMLRIVVIDMLFMFYELQHIIKYSNECSHLTDMFKYHYNYFVEQLDISIVDKDAIPDWNNDEDFFIRLFNYYTNELEWFFV